MDIDSSLRPSAIEKELARRAKEYRISSEMTQKELADKAMVSPKTVARFENGEDISLERFIRILYALGLSTKLEVLLPDPGKRPSAYLPERKGRKRVRHKESKADVSTVWKWGDEE